MIQEITLYIFISVKFIRLFPNCLIVSQKINHSIRPSFDVQSNGRMMNISDSFRSMASRTKGTIRNSIKSSLQIRLLTRNHRDAVEQ